MWRPQFGLKSLIWSVLVVASFFAGASWQRRTYRHDRLRWELNRRDFRNIVFEQHEQMESMGEELQALRRRDRASDRQDSTLPR